MIDACLIVAYASVKDAPRCSKGTPGCLNPEHKLVTTN